MSNVATARCLLDWKKSHVPEVLLFNIALIVRYSNFTFCFLVMGTPGTVPHFTLILSRLELL